MSKPQSSRSGGPHANIHEIYDRVARDWARNEPKVHDDLIGRPFVLKLARKYGRGKRILDAGCGDGNMCRLVSPFAHEVVGVDFSREMIAVAKDWSQRYANLRYVRADIRRVDRTFPAASFDLCLALYTVCCMTNRRQLRDSFSAISRVLAAGAYAVIQIPHPLEAFFGERSQWLQDEGYQGSYFDRGQFRSRKLKTVAGSWLQVARYHFPIGDYVDAITCAGLNIEQFFEPRPTPSVLRKYASLGRESRLPSSIVFLARN